MRKTDKILAYLLLGLLFGLVPLVSSCSMLETDEAGDFKGMWHLESITDTATGEITDLSNEKIFWSFQNKLLELDDKGGPNESCLLRFSYADGNLVLSEPYIFDRDNGDKPLEDVLVLEPYGIGSLNEVFVVEALKGSKMVLLSSGGKRLYLKHF